MPMEPPMLRTTLKAAVALPRRSLATVARASVVSGTNEERGADQEEPLAAEQPREPAGGRDDDGVGGEIGGQHPGDLVDAGRQRALHVRQRDVGDARVDDLHHRHQHDGDGDGPLARGGQLRRRRRRHQRRRMVTTADMPARSGCGLPTSFWSSSTFTGTRCTTFTQLPVAFSGGSNEKRAPVPALIDSTMPWKTLPGNPSISTSAR